MKIFKYPIIVEDSFTLKMPEGARPLCVQIQHGVPWIWAAVDPMEPDVDHVFHVCGTGHERNEISVEQYIGTFQLASGGLVFHVFDGGEPVL